jgi:hypothetical protein
MKWLPLPTGGNLLDTFSLADIDTSGTNIYIGNTDINGRWCIAKFDALTNQMRYSHAKDGYTAAWSGRSSLTYTTFDKAF